MQDNCAGIIDALVLERKRKGLSQRQLAEIAQLPQPAIARLERKKTVPNLDTLLRVANALECNVLIVPSS